MGSEPMLPISERSKTVLSLDHMVTLSSPRFILELKSSEGNLFQISGFANEYTLYTTLEDIKHVLCF
jgi:hypothetical protein